MGTCETCRHWTPSFDRWGSCEFQRELVHVESGELDTRADFGCVAHEPGPKAAPADEAREEYDELLADAERGSPHLTKYMGKALAHILKRLGPPA